MLNAINKYNRIHRLDKPYSIKQLINKFDNNYFNSYFLVNLSDIDNKVNLWNTHLPNIKPYYAIKSNPDINLINRLNKNQKINFDCASKNEIELIKNLNIESNRIIYANPCKSIDHLTYAKDNNINLMTFDSSNELDKIKLYHPNANLILRIQVDDSKSKCKFNTKFGAPIENIDLLIKKCICLNLNLVGVSFHVGSGCLDNSVYESALEKCKYVCDVALKEFNIKLKYINLGGGFLGDNNNYFINTSDVINKSIYKYFHNFNTYNFIAEPGRFFCTSAYTLVTKVASKNTDDSNNYKYYLTDGVYGSFNNTIFDHTTVELKTFNNNPPLFNSKFFGPTCDSIDEIKIKTKYPELVIGDIVYIENMGAYTSAAASNFNGFDKANFYYYEYV